MATYTKTPYMFRITVMFSSLSAIKMLLCLQSAITVQIKRDILFLQTLCLRYSVCKNRVCKNKNKEDNIT